ncbi:ThuA domain-containing protein [Streptomyces sp. NPDC002577]
MLDDGRDHRPAGGGLSRAVRAGTGLAGRHGGIVDAYRAETRYQLMTGGQFVHRARESTTLEARPVPGMADHPVLAGTGPFTVTIEQYYLQSLRRPGAPLAGRVGGQGLGGRPRASRLPGRDRGYGIADLARAHASGTPHRASGRLAYHVLEVMEVLLAASESGQALPVTSTCVRPAAVPVHASRAFAARTAC